MIKIGVTGGIGSGKSFICGVLERMNYPVFYTDQVAKTIMITDSILINQVKSLFGDAAYSEDGILNRELIASKIFSNEDLRIQLNSYVHPAVYRAFDTWCDLQKSHVVFIESALMIETGFYKQLDATILVTADIDTRIKRIKQREAITEEQIKARIQAQTDDDYKQKFANFRIDNSENQMIIPQINQILNSLKQN